MENTARDIEIMRLPDQNKEGPFEMTHIRLYSQHGVMTAWLGESRPTLARNPLSSQLPTSLRPD